MDAHAAAQKQSRTDDAVAAGECEAGRARVLVRVRQHNQRVERKVDCIVRQPACEESCLQRQARAHHARKDALHRCARQHGE